MATDAAGQAEMVLMIGTETPWGEIVGVSIRDGERFYFLLDADKTVSLMPADVVEANAKSGR